MVSWWLIYMSDKCVELDWTISIVLSSLRVKQQGIEKRAGDSGHPVTSLWKVLCIYIGVGSIRSRCITTLSDGSLIQVSSGPVAPNQTNSLSLSVVLGDSEMAPNWRIAFMPDSLGFVGRADGVCLNTITYHLIGWLSTPSPLAGAWQAGYARFRRIDRYTQIVLKWLILYLLIQARSYLYSQPNTRLHKVNTRSELRQDNVGNQSSQKWLFLYPLIQVVSFLYNQSNIRLHKVNTLDGPEQDDVATNQTDSTSHKHYCQFITLA